MLRLDLIKKAVEEKIAAEQKNIVQTTNYIEKPFYYNENTVTKAASTASKSGEQTINPRELLGTKVVFPSDEAAKDGGYLIYISPSFVQGKTVYKLFDKQSSEQRKNTVKVKESNLDKYVYQIDPNGDPTQETTEDGEDIPEVEDLDKAVTRNREQTINPKTEVETDEEYQARFMEEYHDLVRDINGELRDIDPEMVRKQLVARAKEKELEIKQREVEQLYNTAIERLLSAASCLSQNPTSKSILNFYSVLKAALALPGNQCQELIRSLIDIYQEKHPELVKKLEELEIAETCELTPEKAQELKEDLEFIMTKLDGELPGQISDEKLVELKENIAYAAVLNVLGDHVDDKFLANFYKEKSPFLKYIKIKLSKSKDPKKVIAACLRFVLEGIPPFQGQEEKIFAARARELVSMLGTLYNLREKDRLLKRFGFVKKKKGKKEVYERDEGIPVAPNIFAKVAAEFLAPMLGVRAKVETRKKDQFPFYMASQTDSSTIITSTPSSSTSGAPSPAAVFSNPEIKVLEKLLDGKGSFKDFLNNLENFKLLKNQQYRQGLQNWINNAISGYVARKIPTPGVTNPQVLAALKKLNDALKAEQDASQLTAEDIKNIQDAANILKETIDKQLAEERKKEKASSPAEEEKDEATNISDLPELLAGVQTVADGFNLKELFEGIWIFGANGPREQAILKKISENVLEKLNFNCEKNKEKCEKLKASIILFLSTQRSYAYNGGALTTPKGEAFENFVFLDVLQQMMSSGLDPESMRFNGKQGIEAFNEYLRCASNSSRDVLKNSTEIQASLDNQIIATKPNSRLGKVLGKIKEIAELPSDGVSFPNHYDQDDKYQAALVAVEDMTKGLSAQDKKKLKEIFYKRQGLSEISADLNNPPTSTQSKRRRTERQLKDIRAKLEAQNIVERTLQRRTEDEKFQFQELIGKKGASFDKKKPDSPVEIGKFVRTLKVNENQQVSYGNFNFSITGIEKNILEKLLIASQVEESDSLSEEETSLNEVHEKLIEEFERRLTESEKTKYQGIIDKINNGEDLGNIPETDFEIAQILNISKQKKLKLNPQPEDQTQENAEQKSLFLNNRISFIIKSLEGNSESSDCPPAVIKTSVEQTYIDEAGVEKTQIVAVDQYNPNAFLIANYADSKNESGESGVFVLGLSKVNGIPGEEAGFGDIAFLRAKNMRIDAAGNLQKISEDAIVDFSLDVFEGKLVVEEAGINFNAFGRMVGAGNAAMHMFREFTSEADPPSLDVYVIKAEGRNGLIKYSDAKIQKDAIGFMHQQIQFDDKDALIDRNMLQQLDLAILAQVRATGSKDVQERNKKNALAFFYDGIPNKSALEFRTVAAYPGYVALILNGATNKLKQYWAATYPDPSKSENDIAIDMLSQMWSATNKEEMLLLLPEELRNNNAVIGLIDAFIAERSILQDPNNANNKNFMEVFSAAVSNVQEALKQPILKHYRYALPTDAEINQITPLANPPDSEDSTSDKEPKRIHVILEKLNYKELDSSEKRKITHFLQENGYLDENLPDYVVFALNSQLTQGATLGKLIEAHNKKDGEIQQAFKYSYKEQADRVHARLRAGYAPMLGMSNNAAEAAGQKFLQLYLKIAFGK